MCETTPSGTIVNQLTQDLQFESSGTLRADERRMAGGDADWRLAIFDVETADDVHAGHWRSTPSPTRLGCLHGAIRLCLRASPDTPDDLVRLLPGRAVIVPRDRLHWFGFDEPSCSHSPAPGSRRGRPPTDKTVRNSPRG